MSSERFSEKERELYPLFLEHAALALDNPDGIMTPEDLDALRRSQGLTEEEAFNLITAAVVEISNATTELQADIEQYQRGGLA